MLYNYIYILYKQYNYIIYIIIYIYIIYKSDVYTQLVVNVYYYIMYPNTTHWPWDEPYILYIYIGSLTTTKSAE